MPLAVDDLLGIAAVVLLYGLLAVVAIAVAIGLPYLIGKTVYDRARSDDLSNPAALGFGAAFFAVLLGLFVTGVTLLWFS